MAREPFDDDPENDDIEYVSKTQLKRDAHALQELGRKLVKMPAAQLARLPLDDELREAIGLAQRIRHKHGGFKRQIQFIGKLLRGMDTGPLTDAIERIEMRDRQANAAFHRLEKWRDRLIDEGDEALAALLECYPQADRQHIRALTRNAMRERKQNKPPAAARALFKYLRELDETGDSD